jgi:hypothetical protein
LSTVAVVLGWISRHDVVGLVKSSSSSSSSTIHRTGFK